MDNDFRQRISNMSNYAGDKELPEFAKGVEHKAKGIIGEIEQKYRKQIYKTMDKVTGAIYLKVHNYNGRVVAEFSFLTNGCNMKKLGSCWNCNYGIKNENNVSQQEYISEFENLLNKYKGNAMVIGSGGSITDGREFSRDTFIKIIDLALEKGNFKYVDIETHITQIDEEVVRYIANKNLELPADKRKEISFEVGIEDFNPNNRKLINKLGIDNKKIQEIYEMLRKYGIGLDVNLIYGFPFQNENERISSMIDNIRYVNENLPEAGVILFLMSVKENTIMQHMKVNGFYKLANPWGFVEAIKEVLHEDVNNYIGFAWFGEKNIEYIGETEAYCCPECEKIIINAVEALNGTTDKNERNKIMKDLLSKANKLECNHYLEFQQQLEEERKNKTTKTPESRLHDYYEYIINNQTGAEVKYPDEPEL